MKLVLGNSDSLGMIAVSYLVFFVDLGSLKLSPLTEICEPGLLTSWGTSRIRALFRRSSRNCDWLSL